MIASDARLDRAAAASFEEVEGADFAALDPSGSPIIITFKNESLRLPRSSKESGEKELRQTLGRVVKALGLEQTELVLRNTWVDEIGYRHAVFDQKLQGLPVVAGDIVVHFDASGKLESVSGPLRKAKHRTLSGVAKVDFNSARTKARERTAGFNRTAGNGRLVFVYVPSTGEISLAWEVKVEATTLVSPISDIVYVDAASGVEIERSPQVKEALYREIYDANQTETWGVLARAEGGQAHSDSDVNTNYNHLGVAYSYFLNKHQLDGYNGGGAVIKSTVDYKLNYNNAFWDGSAQRFAFGDGDGIRLRHLTDGRDIVGHEYTHAVYQFAPVRNGLSAFGGEPAAINESISDIFGAMSDAWARAGGAPSSVPLLNPATWKIGEDVYVASGSHTAMRYMDDPERDYGAPQFDPQPPPPYNPAYYKYSRSWYPTRYQGSEDFNGVHMNNGIGNQAFYLTVTGGTHPRRPAIRVPALGVEAAQKIFYKAQRDYLGLWGQYDSLRVATAQAAQALASAGQVPANSAQIMHLVWDAVGVKYVSGNNRPVNISTRADVGYSGENATVGFVIAGGSTPQTVLIRGIGPTLGSFGVPGALPNPQLSLTGGSINLYNNDWYLAGNAGQIASTAQSLGAFALPNPSLDAAILTSLGSGGYTGTLSPQNGVSGNGLVEVYAADYNNPNHLVNLSTRARVTNNPVTAGFVVTGEGYKRFLIRGVGPTLGSFGVPGVLANPQVKVYVGSTVIYSNDNWQSQLPAYLVDSNPAILRRFATDADVSSAAAATGAFSLGNGSADAALVVDLPPGIYTVELTGVGGGTGVGMVEVYEVP